MPKQPWHPHAPVLGLTRRAIGEKRPGDSRFAWLSSPEGAPVTTAEALELAALGRQERNG